MPSKRIASLVLTLGLALAAPAAAQITGRPLEVSGSAGWFIPDGRARMQTSLATQATLGWRVLPGLSIEGHATFGPSHADTLPHQRHNFTQAGVDFRWNLRDAESKTVPYVLTGAGVGESHTSGHPPDKLQKGSASLGLGLLQTVFNQRTYLRLEVRDMMFREREALEFSNHIAVTAGIQFIIGGKVHDSDLDGVRDWLDKCPNTPLGAKVTPDGCPIDSDRDSVYDGIDKCPNTPIGCIVDKNGCPADSDGDGVCDGVDVCPNTPRGLRVDARGCPIEVMDKETQLLDTGMIRLSNVQFDTGKDSIKAGSYAVLDSVGMVLEQYPTLKIEVGGHTDNRGTPDKNQKLSEARATSVLRYVTAKFPAINAGQFTSKGYGQSAPIAPNSTTAGRAKNRRVEFKVMNPGALRVERERRRFVPKTGAAPPDTTRKLVLPETTPKPAPPDTIPRLVPRSGSAPPDTTRKP